MIMDYKKDLFLIPTMQIARIPDGTCLLFLIVEVPGRFGHSSHSSFIPFMGFWIDGGVLTAVPDFLFTCRSPKSGQATQIRTPAAGFM
jgi:hypothetical protein